MKRKDKTKLHIGQTKRGEQDRRLSIRKVTDRVKSKATNRNHIHMPSQRSRPKLSLGWTKLSRYEKLILKLT